MPQPFRGVAMDGGRQVTLVVFQDIVQIVLAVGISLHHGEDTCGTPFPQICILLWCPFWFHDIVF